MNRALSLSAQNLIMLRFVHRTPLKTLVSVIRVEPLTPKKLYCKKTFVRSQLRNWKVQYNHSSINWQRNKNLACRNEHSFLIFLQAEYVNFGRSTLSLVNIRDYLAEQLRLNAGRVDAFAMQKRLVWPCKVIQLVSHIFSPASWQMCQSLPISYYLSLAQHMLKTFWWEKTVKKCVQHSYKTRASERIRSNVMIN